MNRAVVTVTAALCATFAVGVATGVAVQRRSDRDAAAADATDAPSITAATDMPLGTDSTASTSTAGVAPSEPSVPSEPTHTVVTPASTDLAATGTTSPGGFNPGMIDSMPPGDEPMLRADQARMVSPLVLLGDSVIAAMNADTYFPEYQAVNRGIDRNQIGNMTERLRGTVLTAMPRCVVVMGGVNDLSLGTPMDWIEGGLRELFDEILAAEANVVVVTTPQPAGGVLAPFVPDDNRRVMNDWIRQQAAADPTHILLADFGRIVDELGPERFAELTVDGYHLAPAGYALLTDVIEPQLDACLG